MKEKDFVKAEEIDLNELDKKILNNTHLIKGKKYNLFNVKTNEKIGTGIYLKSARVKLNLPGDPSFLFGYFNLDGQNEMTMISIAETIFKKLT